MINSPPLQGTVLQEVDKQIVSSFVEEEIAFGPSNLALPRSVIETRIQTALEEIGIYELKKRFTSALSGGQKQRVAISDILAMEPQMLLFDEPLANLDSQGVRLMQDVFNSVPLIVPVSINAMLSIHDISDAMELRALGTLKKRTWYRESQFRRLDYVSIVVIAVSLMIAIYARILFPGLWIP
jgi:energy-coupling factor transporter ATP-binding protein EcfA2